MRIWRSVLIGLLFLVVTSLLIIQPTNVKAEDGIVYLVPIKDTVEDGLYAFIDRALTTAEENGAKVVIFEVDTPGGAVNSATRIGKRMQNTPVATVAYVNNRALSAGAYISLNTDKIYMAPNATMGSAAVIDAAGNAASLKAQSAWVAAMKTAAEQNGRDPIYAQAMADVDINLPEYDAGKGKLLTFTAGQAKKAGYSEGTVSTKSELYKFLGVEDASIQSIDESIAEKIARFLTNPFVIPVLLLIAGIGIVMELFTPGFGIPGTTGLIALLLYFYGHFVAGLAGYEVLVLFISGVLLCILELFIPGGIVGALGMAAVIVSLFLASNSPVQLGISLLVALAVSILVFILLVKVFGKEMKFFRKIVLKDSTSSEQGYISNVSRIELVGMEGITLVDLRPSGTAEINGERLDVVSEGSFISKNSKVKVVKAEGSRIVVREI
ncbi:NfeD family protein [Peribacillus huizhouensis]|uniref:Membrane-bound serine protease (ClpP class) n=1 Tax=Peribacillus huizhouensis TaxID=1501239 RepID=A0ABR6CM92_9BACI|nr:nodulation protein NfeD [Peribacillus huizhouensis]MBA9025482.1 membrane-bound serine protease (ClpP class) [Peribacillus huizhouensis]